MEIYMSRQKTQPDPLLKQTTAANQRIAFFLAYLIESADNQGVIRKSVRQMEGEIESRNIFMGAQIGIWIHNTIGILMQADVLEKVDRLGRLNTLQRTVMGLHYFIKLRNPTRIGRLLKMVPKLRFYEDDLKKVRIMDLEDDPHVIDEENEITEDAFEKALSEEVPF